MSILHVRDVPEMLHTRLKQRAAAQRRSLNAEAACATEAIALLEWAVAEVERVSEPPLASIRLRRFFAPDAVGAPDSTALLREDRER
jgi:plasmid stability protein